MKTVVLSPEAASLKEAADRSATSARSLPCPSLLRQVWLIAGKEFNDRFRSGWVVACVLVWLGAICLTSFLGLLQAGRIGVQGYERTVITLLNLVQYLVPLLGLLLGHDLVVSELEDKTLRLVLARGVSRMRLLLGKFLGGALTLSVPLLMGFAISGTVIGLTARDAAVWPFLRLALTGLALGVIFLGLGLAISAFARSRVQALVILLLTWCCVVFVFDLVALGMTLSTRAPAAVQEIDLVCDPTHLNAAADIHSMNPDLEGPQQANAQKASSGPGWLAINPLDLFRVVNLPSQTGVTVSWRVPVLSLGLWLLLPFLAALWKLKRTDL